MMVLWLILERNNCGRLNTWIALTYFKLLRVEIIDVKDTKVSQWLVNHIEMHIKRLLKIHIIDQIDHSSSRGVIEHFVNKVSVKD